MATWCCWEELTWGRTVLRPTHFLGTLTSSVPDPSSLPLFCITPFLLLPGLPQTRHFYLQHEPVFCILLLILHCKPVFRHCLPCRPHVIPRLLLLNLCGDSGGLTFGACLLPFRSKNYCPFSDFPSLRPQPLQKNTYHTARFLPLE